MASRQDAKFRRATLMNRIKSATSYILLICLIGVIVLMQHNINLAPERIGQETFDVGHLPSGKYMDIVTFGYNSLAAHMLWLSAINAFGGLYRTPGQDYTSILHLFDVITDLEPQFIDAYKFGQLVIGEEANRHELALNLIDKGIIKNYREAYELPYWGFYDSLYNLNNPKRAKFYWKLAAKCRDAPEWVERMGLYIERKAGKYRVAAEKYLRDYLEAVDKQNETLQKIYWSNFRSTLQEWAEAVLKDANEQYVSETGQQLKSLDQLVERGYLKGLEFYSRPLIRMAIQDYQNRGESLASHFEEIEQRGLIRGNVLPEIARDPRYGLIVDQKTGNIRKLEALQSEIKAILEGRPNIRDLLKRYMLVHGDYPDRLTDLPPLVDEEGNLKYPEPIAGEWVYDPEFGLICSPVFPDL